MKARTLFPDDFNVRSLLGSAEPPQEASPLIQL
jgi:hypothetical protein